MLVLFSLLLQLACVGETEKNVPTPPQKLVEASEEVIFASVEVLGAHQFQATYQQKEFHGEEERSNQEEILLIQWNNWDDFQFQRFVEEEVVTHVIIHDSKTKDLRGGNWVEREDGEPYRVQLRNTWNQWDSVMRHFHAFVEWEKVGEEILEGRKTSKYKAKFSVPENSKKTLKPLRFDGVFWVDQETAVRILGEISGVLVRGPYKKELQYKIERTHIGENNRIVFPE